MIVDKRKVNLAEKDLEDYLFQYPGLVNLNCINKKIARWIGRQVYVPSGIIDLFGITEDNILAVVEVKNTPFESKHLTQVCRYAKDIEEAASLSGMIFPTIVYKILIGVNSPCVNIITEANALDVILLTIDVVYDLKMSGWWGYSESYKSERRNKLIKLSEMEVFKNLVSLHLKMFGDEINDSLINSPDENGDTNA